MDRPIIYNPQVIRTCPRCRERFYQFTEGGRVVVRGTVVENQRATRNIVCVACGHKWRGRLTRSERGIA